MTQNLDESAYSDKPNQPETPENPPKIPRDIDASAFVEALVTPIIGWATERPALSWTLPDGRQPAVEWNPGPIAAHFTHLSVGLFRINDPKDAEDGKLTFRRRADRWTGNLAIVLDDVGESKHGVTIKRPPIDPTVIIETKPGSEQWWFVFKEPLRNAATVDRMMRTLVEAGYGDKGGSTGRTSLIRLARLPGSDPKGRGFPARIVFEDWRRRFVPDAELLLGKQGFGIKTIAAAWPILTADRSVLILQNGEDPLLDWLSANGQVLEPAPNSQGWIAIHCPWAGQHTGGDTSGSGYRAAKPAGANCYHGSCAHREPHDFFTHWQMAGAPVLPEAGPVDEDAVGSRFARLLTLSPEIQRLHTDRDAGHESIATAMPLAMALARCRMPWPDAGWLVADYWLEDTRPASVLAAQVIAWRASEMMAAQHAAYDSLDLNFSFKNNMMANEAFLTSLENRNV